MLQPRKILIFALLLIAAGVCVHAQSNTQHAFLWSPTTGMQDLGSLGGNSYAYSINNSGHVVGYYIDGFGNSRAFLWTSSGGMRDISARSAAVSAGPVESTLKAKS